MYDRQTIKHTTQNTSWPDPSKQAHMQWRENTPVHYVSGFNFSSKIRNSSFWKLGFFLKKIENRSLIWEIYIKIELKTFYPKKSVQSQRNICLIIFDVKYTICQLTVKVTAILHLNPNGFLLKSEYMPCWPRCQGKRFQNFTLKAWF